MAYRIIQLKRGKEESLRRFHPWVFSGAIHQTDSDLEEGDIVRVVTSTGEFIAVARRRRKRAGRSECPDQRS